METKLSTAGEVIDALGGTFKAAEKLRMSPQAVSNWRSNGRIPARLFLSVDAALKAESKSAAPGVFGMAVPDDGEAA